jgi:hypothetical protein
MPDFGGEGIIDTVRQQAEELYPSKPVSPSTAINLPEGFKLTGRVLSPEQFQSERKDYEERSGMLGGAKAAALATARGLSLNLSDLAAVKSGLLTQDEIQKYQDLWPKLSTTGEIAGAVAPVLLTGGSGMAAKALGAPSYAAFKAGQMAEGLVAAGLETGAKKTIAKQILASALGGAANAATYGTALETGKIITEAGLGNPDLTSEKIIARIGMAALLNGTMGAVLGPALTVGPSVLDKARAASLGVDDFITRAENAAFRGIAKTAGKTYNVPEEYFMDVAGSKAAREAVVKPDVIKMADREAAIKNVTDVVDSAEQIKNGITRELKPAQIKISVDNSKAGTARAAVAYDELKTYGKSILEEMKAKPNVYNQTVVNDFENALQSMAQKEASTKGLMKASDVYNLGEQFKYQLDDMIPWAFEITDASERAAINKVKDLRFQAKQFITNDQIWGEMGGKTSLLNDLLKTHYDLLEFGRENQWLRQVTDVGGIGKKTVVNAQRIDAFLKDMEKPGFMYRNEWLTKMLENTRDLAAVAEEMGKSAKPLKHVFESSERLAPLIKKQAETIKTIEKQVSEFSAQSKFKHLQTGSSPIGMVGNILHLAHPTKLLKAYALIQREAGAVTSQIGDALGAFFKAAGSPNIRPAAIPTGVRVLQNTSFGERSRKQSKQEAYKDQLQKLSQFMAAPEASLTKFQENTKEMRAAAPKLADALVQKQAAAVKYLYDNAPKQSEPSVFKTEYKPSDQELSAWARKFEIANNPLSVLDELKHGSLTKEHVEALSVLSPNLHAEIKNKMIDYLTEHEGNVAYKDRVGISLIMGIPIEKTMRPDFVMAMQQAHQAPGAQGPFLGAPMKGQGQMFGGSKASKVTENRESAVDKLQKR